MDLEDISEQLFELYNMEWSGNDVFRSKEDILKKLNEMLDKLKKSPRKYEHNPNNGLFLFQKDNQRYEYWIGISAWRYDKELRDRLFKDEK